MLWLFISIHWTKMTLNEITIGSQVLVQMLFILPYRFAANDCLGNRKLLWHAVDVSSVAAVLHSGLRLQTSGLSRREIRHAAEFSSVCGYCE